MALAFTESSLDYKVKHKLSGVIGVCGIYKRHWHDLLIENDIKVNSLKACEVVYNELLEQNNNNKRKALKKYKGIVSKKNSYLIDNVLELEEQLKELYETN